MAEQMDVVNPATGEVIARVDATSSADAAATVERARAAQSGWAATPIAQRVATLRRFRTAVAESTESLAATLTSETGKPISQARGELTAVLVRIDFFCDNVEDTLADEEVHTDDGLREVIVHEPLGVVLNISAWNYPWFVGTNVFVPALLAGNAVVYKPSEHATLTGLAIGRLLHEAGVPEDVFVVAVGAGELGSALLSEPIDGVFFTGSHRTGRAIAEAVAGELVKVQLELGGKDPVYVAPDVDVAKAAEGLADGAFYNNGQSCCSVERIYVHLSIADEFIERFVEAVERFALGDPTDEATYLGPLTRGVQAEVLESQVADAVAAGAAVRTGGARVDRDGGTWFAPTVLTGVTNEMAVMREESFGPIIGIATVGDDEEALSVMNDTEYGLTAGVFSADESRAMALLRRLDAGSVYWNCCDRVSPRLPWTGRRHSGIGSTLSTYGILAFTQPKALHLRTP